MKVVVILEVDPEQLIGSFTGGAVRPEEFDGTISGIINDELGWLGESGVIPVIVLEPDQLDPNDFELGAQIRKYL